MVIAFFLTVLIFLSWVSRVKKMAKNYTYSETLHASLILTIFQITSTIFFWGIIAKKLDIDRILLTNVFVALLVTKGRLWIVLNECFMLLKHVKNFLRHVFSYRLLRIIFICIIVQQIWTLGRIHYTSPNVLDTLTYHLPISIKWYQEKAIDLYEPAPIERMNYSTKIPKALNFWILLFSKNITYIEISQYFGYVLLMLSVYTLLRRLNTPLYWTIAGTFIAASLPLVIIENYTLQDHVLLTALHFSVIKILFDLIEGRIEMKRGLIFSGLVIGLLLGSKFSAPAHLLIILIFTFILYYKKIKNFLLKQNLLPFFISLVLILLIGGVWYINNFYNYGSFFGPKILQAEKDNKFLSNLLDFPVRVLDYQHDYSPDLVNISGFGIHFFSFGLLLGGLSLLRKYRSKKRVLLLGSSVVLIGIYFFLYYTPYNYRLFLFFPISFLICAFSLIPDLKKYSQKILAGIAILGLIFTTGATLYVDYLNNFTQNFTDTAKSSSSERSIIRFDFDSDKFNNDQSFLFIDQYIQKDETIAYITQSQDGYDDNIIAAYYDKTLERKALWLGDINKTNYFSVNSRPTSELITYLLSRKINYLHNNIVFYYQFPRTLDIHETPLIELTKNLYFLDSSTDIDISHNIYSQSAPITMYAVPSGQEIAIPIDAGYENPSLTLEVTFSIQSSDNVYLGFFLNESWRRKRISSISNIYLKGGEVKKVTYVLTPSERQKNSHLVILPKNPVGELAVSDMSISTLRYKEKTMNVDFLKGLNFVNKGIFEESQ